MNRAPKTAEVLEELMADAMRRGIEEGAAARLNATANANPYHDGQGRFTFSPDAEATRGEAAMRTTLEEKADVLQAMHRPELGFIDFRYGDERRGIAHLIARRNSQLKAMGGETGEQIAMRMPRVISHGQIRMEGRDAVVEHEGYRAILTKGWGRNRETNCWLLNGYDISDEKGGRR